MRYTVSSNSLRVKLAQLMQCTIDEVDAASVGRGSELDSLQNLEVAALFAEAGYEVESQLLHPTVTLGDLLRIVSDGSTAPRHSQLAPEAPTGSKLRVGPMSLHPVTRQHIPYLYDLSTAEDVSFRWRFRGGFPSMEAFEESLWTGVLVQLIAFDNEREQPAGHVVCYSPDLSNGNAYVGAVFEGRYIDTGVPALVVQAFVRYIFATWNLRKLYMELPEYNLPSIGSGLNGAFTLEGRLQQHHYYDGRFWDKLILAIYSDRHGLPTAEERQFARDEFAG